MKSHACRWPLATVLLVCAMSAGHSVAGAQVFGPGEHFASTKADAEFMQGMIGHHAQAIVMARQAVSHGASATVRVLCARIDRSQSTEILLMQEWLKARKFVVPDSTGRMPMEHDHAGMAGMAMSDSAMVVMMPGMLTAEQMKLLDDARGAIWDRLFLTFMIQHHVGALTMVDKLFKSPGAGQDEAIFKFATGVHADQTAEIDRMKSMLAGGPEGGHD